MEYLNVLIAGFAAFASGAVWYMALSKPWMAATGITQEQSESGSPIIYVFSLIFSIIAAGMIRHIFALSGIDTVGEGIVSGFGIGLFVVAPWIANTCLYDTRSKSLMWINGGYPVLACTIIGLVLTLF